MNGIWLRRAGLGAIVMSSLVAQAECKLRTLTPSGNSVQVGAATLDLGEADNASTPSAWQGPLVAGACSLNLGIIEPPLVLTPTDLVYVPTYSGSVRRLTLVDFGRCSVRWKSAPFSGDLKIGSHELNLGGKRIALDAQCLPNPDPRLRQRTR